MDHHNDALNYINPGGWNCKCIAQDYLYREPAESEMDWNRRFLLNCSEQTLKEILKDNIEYEEYEFCAIIRDIAIKRGIKLA